MYLRRHLANDVLQTRFSRAGAAHKTLCQAVVRRYVPGEFIRHANAKTLTPFLGEWVLPISQCNIPCEAAP